MEEAVTISSTAIKRHKSPKFDSQKLTIAGVVFGLLILAVAVGLALAANPPVKGPVTESDLEKQNQKLLNELNEAKLTISQLEKEDKFTYCPTGDVYRDPGRNFKICYPTSWKVLPSLDEQLTLESPEGDESALFTLTSSRDEPIVALKRLTAEIITLSGNDQYEINEQKAFLYTGRLRAGEGRKIIAIVSKNNHTFEAVMTVGDVVNFGSYLTLFKKTIDTFTFIQ